MNQKATSQTPALVLSGGGARAAYQVGVLKAIAERYPRNHSCPFPIICGTSAGAINGTALACYATCFRLGVKKIEWIWSHFSTEQVYKSSSSALLRHLLSNLINPWRADHAALAPAGLLNNQPLRQLLAEVLDLDRLERNIAKRALTALAVTASCYTTGDSVSFFQGCANLMPWQRARRRGERTRLNFDHLIASASIPLVFPPTWIGNGYFGDGAIHQLAPFSPAIRLGATRILLIGTAPAVMHSPKRPQQQSPGLSDVAGHLLDSVFADSLQADLERLTKINQLLNLLPKQKAASLSITPIETLTIHPDVDINQIASFYTHLLPRTIQHILKLAGIEAEGSSSLLSYILFESCYCRELIQAGYSDAQQRMDEIIAFLCGH